MLCPRPRPKAISKSPPEEIFDAKAQRKTKNEMNLELMNSGKEKAGWEPDRNDA
jgi:hypothetical protein